MNLAVDGNNAFHVGWLTRFLGLPKKLPAASAVKSEYLSAFFDGWEMCDETPISGTPNRLDAFYAMRKLEQASAFWVDDENNEIETS
jgi:hypothetical protein